jgi:hypothetical protein
MFTGRFWCGSIRGFDMAVTDQTNQAGSTNSKKVYNRKLKIVDTEKIYNKNYWYRHGNTKGGYEDINIRFVFHLNFE